MRASGQGYGGADTARQKYAGMEGDDATGMAHTLWRQYDSFSGRWTAPDPYSGSMSVASPQSFNRYSYVENNPVNSVDPLGLALSDIGVVQTDDPATARELEHASDRAWKVAMNAEYTRQHQAPQHNQAPHHGGPASSSHNRQEHHSEGGDPGEHSGSDDADPSHSAARALRIMLIVGRPGIQENAGANFMRAAQTRRANLKRSGKDAFIVPVAIEADFSAALINNGMLDGVEYFGHSGPDALFIGDGYSDEVTLDSSELSQLSNRNLNFDATIILHGCKTAVGDRNSIAARLSVQLERTTFGYDQDSMFSTNPDHRTGAVTHPSRGPTYMVPKGGGGMGALRAFSGAMWPKNH